MSDEDLDRLRDAVESQLGGSWVDTIEWIRDQPANSVEAITERLHAGDLNGAVRGVEAAATRFAADVADGHTKSGKAAAKWLDDAKPDKLITYDTTNPRAKAWAERNRAELVVGATQETRDVITQVVGRGVNAGTNPREIARDLRDSIGLTAHQESHVASFRKALESRDFGDALDRKLADGTSKRSIRAAQRADRALTPAQINKMVERYRTKYVAHRAEVIARTEALRAVHQGTDEMYQQAIENGDVEADELEQEWHVGGGPRTRDWHASMRGQKRRIGEAFIDGNGNRLMYPGDPSAPAKTTINCRCSKSTRMLPPKQREADAATDAGAVPVTPPAMRASSDENAKAMKAMPFEPARALSADEKGDNTAYVAELEDGSEAIWKPKDGEIGSRAGIRKGTFYKREAATSAVAGQLGVEDLVPSTVTRKLDGKLGSLQHMVTDAVVLGDLSVAVELDLGAAERMRVFDFVVGNSDRHAHNVMIAERDGKRLPVLIDGGLNFPSGPPATFIQPWTAIPKQLGGLLPSTLAQIGAIDLVKLAATLRKAGIDKEAVIHTLYRAKAIQLTPEMLEVPTDGYNATAWGNVTSAHKDLTEDERNEIAAIVRKAFKS